MADPVPDTLTAEGLARFFHETYERLAPEHGWETQEASRTEWDAVPESNKGLTIAVAGEVLAALAAHDQQGQAGAPEGWRRAWERGRANPLPAAPHVHDWGPSGQCECGEDRTSYVESEGTEPEVLSRVADFFERDDTPDGGELDDLLADADFYLCEYGTRGRTIPQLVEDLTSALRSQRGSNDLLGPLEESLLRRQVERRDYRIAGLERELAEARAGLEHINRHGCEHNTRGSCLTDPSMSRDAEYGADQWCDPCIAADALGKKENSRG